MTRAKAKQCGPAVLEACPPLGQPVSRRSLVIAGGLGFSGFLGSHANAADAEKMAPIKMTVEERYRTYDLLTHSTSFIWLKDIVLLHDELEGGMAKSIASRLSFYLRRMEVEAATFQKILDERSKEFAVWIIEALDKFPLDTDAKERILAATDVEQLGGTLRSSTETAVLRSKGVREAIENREDAKIILPDEEDNSTFYGAVFGLSLGAAAGCYQVGHTVSTLWQMTTKDYLHKRAR